MVSTLFPAKLLQNLLYYILHIYLFEAVLCKHNVETFGFSVLNFNFIYVLSYLLELKWFRI